MTDAQLSNVEWYGDQLGFLATSGVKILVQLVMPDGTRTRPASMYVKDVRDVVSRHFAAIPADDPGIQLPLFLLLGVDEPYDPEDKELIECIKLATLLPLVNLKFLKDVMDFESASGLKDNSNCEDCEVANV